MISDYISQQSLIVLQDDFLQYTTGGDASQAQVDEQYWYVRSRTEWSNVTDTIEELLAVFDWQFFFPRRWCRRRSTCRLSSRSVVMYRRDKIDSSMSRFYSEAIHFKICIYIYPVSCKTMIQIIISGRCKSTSDLLFTPSKPSLYPTMFPCVPSTASPSNHSTSSARPSTTTTFCLCHQLFPPS